MILFTAEIVIHSADLVNNVPVVSVSANPALWTATVPERLVIPTWTATLSTVANVTMHVSPVRYVPVVSAFCLVRRDWKTAMETV